MPTQNQLLKEIAEKLGGNVGKNDNDTNELLALIRDNIGNAGGGSGSSGGGSKLYNHVIEIPLVVTGSSTHVNVPLITNFETPLDSTNIVSLLSDFYGLRYGSVIIFNKWTAGNYTDVHIDFNAGIYPGASKNFTVCYTNGDNLLSYTVQADGSHNITDVCSDPRLYDENSILFRDTVTPL